MSSAFRCRVPTAGTRPSRFSPGSPAATRRRVALLPVGYLLLTVNRQASVADGSPRNAARCSMRAGAAARARVALHPVPDADPAVFGLHHLVDDLRRLG